MINAGYLSALYDIAVQALYRLSPWRWPLYTTILYRLCIGI